MGGGLFDGGSQRAGGNVEGADVLVGTVIVVVGAGIVLAADAVDADDVVGDVACDPLVQAVPTNAAHSETREAFTRGVWLIQRFTGSILIHRAAHHEDQVHRI